MVWNTEVFVNSLQVPGFKLIVERPEIPEDANMTPPPFENRQKFVAALASWVGMRNLQVEEVDWVVVDSHYGVSVLTRNPRSELQKDVITFLNGQINYMLTHGTFATPQEGQYFWMDGGEERSLSGLDTFKNGENPFPPELVSALAGMQPPPCFSKERGLITFPREQVLRSANTYLRGLVKRFSGEIDDLRYLWVELKQYQDSATGKMKHVACDREEATHVLFGVEVFGYAIEHIVSIKEMVTATRYWQFNQVNSELTFWTQVSVLVPETSVGEDSPALDERFTSAISNIDKVEEVEQEFQRSQENLSKLMASTLHRATDVELPQRNDGFIPLRAVAGLLTDFKNWLETYYHALIQDAVGNWGINVFVSSTTTVTLELTDQISFRRFIVTYDYNEFFKDHIAAGLDWHPEARTFWCLPR